MTSAKWEALTWRFLIATLLTALLLRLAIWALKFSVVWDIFYESLMIAISILGLFYNIFRIIPWKLIIEFASQRIFLVLLLTLIVVALWNTKDPKKDFNNRIT